MFLKAVIDSGPLFSALISNYNLLSVDYGRPASTAGLEDPLLDQPAQRWFLELLSSIDGIGDMEYIEDASIMAGGVKVETGTGEVDARLDSQFDVIKKAMLS